jgi:protease-4
MQKFTQKFFSGVAIFFMAMIAIELLVIIGAIFGSSSYPSGDIAVVKVEGQITDGLPTVIAIKKFREDENIKAIVMRIDTPGGAVAASQEIHDEIIKTRKVKPVIASMGNTAASGGYYIAVACDYIMAAPGTVTGSIGVITQYFMIDELLKKFDLRWEIITSGKNKALGSPFQDMTPEQRKVLQGLIDDIYNQFVTAVAKGRSMDQEVVRPLADGRIFTGQQAKEHGLVDEMGNLYDAIDWAKNKAGLKDKPDVFIYPKEQKPFLEVLTGASTKWPEWFQMQYKMF